MGNNSNLLNFQVRNFDRWAFCLILGCFGKVEGVLKVEEGLLKTELEGKRLEKVIF